MYHKISESRNFQKMIFSTDSLGKHLLKKRKKWKRKAAEQKVVSQHVW